MQMNGAEFNASLLKNSYSRMAWIGAPHLVSRFGRRFAGATAIRPQAERLFLQNGFGTIQTMVLGGMTSVSPRCSAMNSNVLLQNPCPDTVKPGMMFPVTLKVPDGSDDPLQKRIDFFLFRPDALSSAELVGHFYSHPLLYGSEDVLKAPPDLDARLKDHFFLAAKGLNNQKLNTIQRLQLLFNACRFMLLLFDGKEDSPVNLRDTIKGVFRQMELNRDDRVISRLNDRVLLWEQNYRQKWG
jgi:hypothetical protein